jgi:hypothetical protein
MEMLPGWTCEPCHEVKRTDRERALQNCIIDIKNPDVMCGRTWRSVRVKGLGVVDLPPFSH